MEGRTMRTAGWWCAISVLCAAAAGCTSNPGPAMDNDANVSGDVGPSDAARDASGDSGTRANIDEVETTTLTMLVEATLA